MKHLESQSLWDRSRQIIPGGVHSPVRSFRGVGGTPCFIKSAQGSKIVDVDQNQYLDFCLSWGPLILGHRDPDVEKAVVAAVSRGWSYGTAEPYSLELAEWITSRLPWIEKIRFVNSGTEAVMAALRLARAFTSRDKILKFEGCYHGHVDSMLVKAGSGLADLASSDSAGVSESTAAQTISVPLNQIAAVEAAFQKHKNQIAAIIVEPIPANNGLLIQTDSFLSDLARIAKKEGALLIFDEVITGFRVGIKGMAGATHIIPDLVTYGKIIGGGFPVGAYGGRADIMKWIAPEGPVYQAGTLSGNPVSMAAGLATLQKLEKLNPYSDLAQKTESLARRLESVAQQKDVRLRVQNSASLFWMIFDADAGPHGSIRAPSEAPSTHKEKYSERFHRLLEKGFYLAPSGWEVSFLSCAHTDADIESFVQAFTEVL